MRQGRCQLAGGASGLSWAEPRVTELAAAVVTAWVSWSGTRWNRLFPYVAPSTARQFGTCLALRTPSSRSRQWARQCLSLGTDRAPSGYFALSGARGFCGYHVARGVRVEGWCSAEHRRCLLMFLFRAWPVARGTDVPSGGLVDVGDSRAIGGVIRLG